MRQVHATAPLGIPLTNFGFACRVERLDLREKLSADQIKELVELFETPLGMIIIDRMMGNNY